MIFRRTIFAVLVGGGFAIGLYLVFFQWGALSWDLSGENITGPGRRGLWIVALFWDSFGEEAFRWLVIVLASVVAPGGIGFGGYIAHRLFFSNHYMQKQELQRQEFLAKYPKGVDSIAEKLIKERPDVVDKLVKRD